MAATDFFGIADRVKTFVAPGAYAGIHKDGYSWARTGTAYADTTRVSAEDWNQLIANFRALLTIPNVVFDDVNPRSAYLLRDTIVSFSSKKIAELLPTAINASLARIMVGNAASNVAIGAGSKTFYLVLDNVGWGIGMRVHIAEHSNPAARWMEGRITSTTLNTITVLVDEFAGAGTFANWAISLSWEPLSPTERDKLGQISVSSPTDLDALRTRVMELDAAVVLQGTWAASANKFPGNNVAQAGQSWICSVAGTVDGVAFEVGDRVTAITDDALQNIYAGYWFKEDYTDRVSSVAGLVGVIGVPALKTALGYTFSDFVGGGVIDDGNLPERFRQSSALVANWDNASTPGFYRSVGAANGPTADTWYGWALNAGAGSGYMHQVVLGYGSTVGNQWWMRRQNDGVWGVWRRLYMTDTDIDSNWLRKNVEDQVLTGGARITPKDLGNLFGATITLDPGDRPIQKVTNNGAGSLLPGANEGQYSLEVINAVGAGAITTTGWTLKGDSFDTTATSKFVCSCLVTADIKLMSVLKVA